MLDSSYRIGLLGSEGFRDFPGRSRDLLDWILGGMVVAGQVLGWRVAALGYSYGRVAGVAVGDTAWA